MTKDEIVKTEIIAHAQVLFQQFGIKKTTMDEIAAACGKGKSTLYHYFKNKEQVFDEVLAKELVNLRVIVKEQVDQANAVKDKLSIYFRVFHKEVLYKVNLYRIVKQELISETSKEVHFTKLMNYEKNYINRILEEGYDAGDCIDIERKDLYWFSEIIIAAFLGIVRYSIESENNFDQEKLDMATDLIIPKLFK
jgi:AcrR family transcriptional regulator